MTEAEAAAPSDAALRDAKAAARKTARAKRAGLANAEAPARLAEALLAGYAPPTGAIIAGTVSAGIGVPVGLWPLPLFVGPHIRRYVVLPPMISRHWRMLGPMRSQTSAVVLELRCRRQDLQSGGRVLSMHSTARPPAASAAVVVASTPLASQPLSVQP